MNTPSVGMFGRQRCKPVQLINCKLCEDIIYPGHCDYCFTCNKFNFNIPKIIIEQEFNIKFHEAGNFPKFANPHKKCIEILLTKFDDV